MRSLSLRNHSSHMAIKVRTRHSKVTPVHQYRQAFSLVTVLSHTMLQAARRLSKHIMETMESQRMRVQLWAEFQSLSGRQAVLLLQLRILRRMHIRRSWADSRGRVEALDYLDHLSSPPRRQTPRRQYRCLMFLVLDVDSALASLYIYPEFVFYVCQDIMIQSGSFSGCLYDGHGRGRGAAHT
jgi:hypothetical protein